MTEVPSADSTGATDSNAALASLAAAEAATAAELKAHEEADAAERKAAQKPTMGRTVHVRSGKQTHPAIIVEVREDGSVDLQVFKADHMQHAAHRVKEAHPETGDGWFWPPQS